MRLPRVALVFDDGPIRGHTKKLLALFAQQKVRVTFGLVGALVSIRPAAAKAIISAGHEIANHSYSHFHPKDLNDEDLEHEISGAQKLISTVTGVAPKWYWPPFLEVDDRVDAAARRAGITVFTPKILVLSRDYKKGVEGDRIKQRVTTNIKDGAVILFHEWNKRTLEQMPAILDELKRQRCIFQTFSELAQS